MPAIKSVNDLDFLPHGDVFPSPADWRDQFIYFLLVDRFDNHLVDSPMYSSDNAPRGRDPAEGALFQGGTIKGITRRLDYIKNLGCTAIWLSPIFKNRQEFSDVYHGYGIQDFLQVDRRFGTTEDLQELVAEAHARGMYVILDIIINHTGDNWAYPGGNPYYFWRDAPGPFDFGCWREADPQDGLQDDDAVWPIELQHPDRYKRRGEIRDWNNPDEAINGDFLSLKELDINQPVVLDTLIKAFKHWIAVADIDGFRMDTVKHTENSATAIFCNAIREYANRIGKHNFFIFGEIVADDQTIQSYLGRNTRLPGTNERFPSLDAALDFPLHFVLDEAIKGITNPDSLRSRYERFKTSYNDHGAAGRYFVTFVDNHDQITRPYRRFMHSNPHTQQAVLAIGYLLTSQGVPCIYYGSEQGFDGGGDNDRYIRECMFGGKWGAFDTTGVSFFNEDNPIYRGISSVAAVRSQEPALRYGRQYFREISGDGVGFGYPTSGQNTLAFSRILDSDELLVAINLDAFPRQDFVTLDRNLTPPGSTIVNLLDSGETFEVRNTNGRANAQVPLGGHKIAILKRQ